MANDKRWMQTAEKRMEAKGTKGSFRKIAAKAGGIDKKTGKIKASFISKEKNSPNPKIRKKANFAANVRKGN